MNTRSGLFAHNSETFLLVQYTFILRFHRSRHLPGKNEQGSICSPRALAVVRRGQVFSGEPSTAMPREDKQSVGMAGKISWGGVIKN